MALLALALRFVPYSDDRGNFDPLWTAVMLVVFLVALSASVYVIVVLEILKLRRVRLRQMMRLGAPPSQLEEVDRQVADELETGEFRAVDPETGEFRAVDPETGEFRVVESDEGQRD